jgi:hypothetical protein
MRNRKYNVNTPMVVRLTNGGVVVFYPVWIRWYWVGVGVILDRVFTDTHRPSCTRIVAN